MRALALYLLFPLLLILAQPGRGNGRGDTTMREQAAEDSLSSLDSTSENAVDRPHPLIFAAFAEDNGQLYHTLVLSESIREFAGKY